MSPHDRGEKNYAVQRIGSRIPKSQISRQTLLCPFRAGRKLLYWLAPQTTPPAHSAATSLNTQLLKAPQEPLTFSRFLGCEASEPTEIKAEVVHNLELRHYKVS